MSVDTTNLLLLLQAITYTESDGSNSIIKNDYTSTVKIIQDVLDAVAIVFTRENALEGFELTTLNNNLVDLCLGFHMKHVDKR